MLATIGQDPVKGRGSHAALQASWHLTFFVLALLSFRAHTMLSLCETLVAKTFVAIGDENAGRAPASPQTEGADARASSFDTN